VSGTFERVLAAVSAGRLRVSQHGFLELKEDGILPDEIFETAPTGMIVEDYPDAWKGPSVLVRQTLAGNKWVHVLWGFAKSGAEEAVLITAYVPRKDQWSADALQRRPT
jgi:Domain of unknown function (DUF4258)